CPAVARRAKAEAQSGLLRATRQNAGIPYRSIEGRYLTTRCLIIKSQHKPQGNDPGPGWLSAAVRRGSRHAPSAPKPLTTDLLNHAAAALIRNYLNSGVPAGDSSCSPPCFSRPTT